MTADPIVLPSSPEVPRRPPVPFLAAAVPVIGGIVLWLITGSPFALCFAALGPLMLGASAIDGARTRRRELRRARADEERGWAQAEEERERRQQAERGSLWQRHPDAAACVTDRPLRETVPVDARTVLVVGRGDRASTIAVTGGEGERARSFRARCAVLADAPITVPLGGGVCIRGPRPVAVAVARAMLVQLCLRFSPRRLHLLGVLDGAEDWGVEGLPHAQRTVRGAWRIAVGAEGEALPDADARIWICAEDAEIPDGIATVVDCVEPALARVRTPQGVQAVAVECLSLAQTRLIAADAAEREDEVSAVPERVRLVELDEPSGGDGLVAAIGRSERGAVTVDLVDDGPHALVTGITGSGKSELLVSWVTAIAAGRSPDEVVFVLADFKGGTAFDPLRRLPHVTAVITDLDEAGARRGVESLRAELRRREGVLADAGARSVDDGGVALPRLVIVVDEFAALLHEHPDLGTVFTDIAARGRALGMHLILGTQRAAGVIRDALSANCPLRISLRVADAADSRSMIGTVDASELPGGAESRGLAFVRRPRDSAPVATRIALSEAADVERIASRWTGVSRPASPWLPALPRSVPLDELRSREASDALILGILDEPERQSQRLVTLEPGRDRGLVVIGGTQAGKSSVIALLAAQHPPATIIPRDPEQAWDLVAALADGDEAAPALILGDDLDTLAARFPTEHDHAFVERLETIVRAGGERGSTVVFTLSRVSGPFGRIVDALPLRALLGMPSKVEHIAAGGDPDGFRHDRAPGRARLGAQEMQFAQVGPGPHRTAPGSAPAPEPDEWRPSEGRTGIVASGLRRVSGALRDRFPECLVVTVGDLRSGTGPDGAVSAPVLIVGDADAWQRQWALWQELRGAGEVLVLAECAAELRSLAGVREVPPFARSHAGRAWALRDGRPPRRVVLPGLAAR